MSASSKHIHRQYGYISQRVKSIQEKPITAAGYKFAIVGVRLPALSILMRCRSNWNKIQDVLNKANFRNSSSELLTKVHVS